MSRAIIRTAVLGTLVSIAATATPAHAGPFRLGLHEPSLFANQPDPELSAQTAASHAQILRNAIYWSDIVTNSPEPPAGFDPRNPQDPNYDWTTVDGFVRHASSMGMQPLLTILAAPKWAEGAGRGDAAEGSYRPDPDAVGDFAYAIARRYDGTLPDPANPTTVLPRVRYFQAWNEPNFGEYLTMGKGEPAAAHYVRMLNAFYSGVKQAKSSNLVLMAGLGPFGFNGHNTDVDPQVFFREVLCLDRSGRGFRKASNCPTARPKFDVLTQHPYTFEGNPTSKAASPDGGAIGNLPEIKEMLDVAVRSRRTLPAGPKGLWVTEFSWFSDPPGRAVASNGQTVQLGKPLPVQARYLSESAYRMWTLGVGAMIWYSLRDLNYWPGGLYFGDGRAKPAARAFRFPFYATSRRGRLTAWGALTDGANSRVRIERRMGSWRTTGTARADRFGIVHARFRAGKGAYRARVLTGSRKGTVSYPFRTK